MSMYNIFDISASGMKAQSIRLTTTASNMSNANVVSGTAEATYKPRYPIFAMAKNDLSRGVFATEPGVGIEGIVESNQPPLKRYEPSHPLANEEGYVFMPNINMVEEMTNMMSASKAYQMNVEILSTTKQLMAQTLQLGSQG